MKHNETWTEQMIADRLIEAARTMRRLPAVKVQGYASAWPEMLFSDIEKMQMELKPEQWPAMPEQITRMEEACRWLRWVPNLNDRRLLWLRAERVQWKLICVKLGIGRTAANERWKNGLYLIIRSLNAL